MLGIYSLWTRSQLELQITFHNGLIDATATGCCSGVHATIRVNENHKNRLQQMVLWP